MERVDEDPALAVGGRCENAHHPDAPQPWRPSRQKASNLTWSLGWCSRKQGNARLEELATVDADIDKLDMQIAIEASLFRQASTQGERDVNAQINDALLRSRFVAQGRQVTLLTFCRCPAELREARGRPSSPLSSAPSRLRSGGTTKILYYHDMQTVRHF